MNAQMETTLEEMTRRLVAEFAPDEVILFGSYAWGQPSEDSDVDLLVIIKSSDETPLERDLRARRCLRGLNTPKDVLVRTRDEMARAKRVAASLESLASERGRQLYTRNLALLSHFCPARSGLSVRLESKP